ncbi:MAG: peptidylprolyl isomerase, partial [Acidobacteria bacterium]
MRARFDASKDRYAFPERRVVTYLLLDLPKLQPRVTVTEAEERAYYDAHQDEFKQAEQVCASHILVKVKSTPEATEGHADADARKLAEAALDQVKAGADFAALAKKMSEDQGSAPGGGSLGCFERGRMVPEFENAAFALT